MYVLSKAAFPRIGEALEKRANAVRENIEASERQRAEADELLEEYRQRLKEAREQADDIVARARKAAEAAVAEATAEGKAKREELVAAARKDIETETRRSLETIRKRGRRPDRARDREGHPQERSTDDDHKRLVEEALAEVDFSALAGDANGGERQLMEEIARVYADALFDVAKDSGKLDEVREQLGEFADAVDEDRDLQVFFFSPYFSSAGEARGNRQGRVGRRGRARQLPRAARREAPDAGDLSHPPGTSTSSGRRRTSASR